MLYYAVKGVKDGTRDVSSAAPAARNLMQSLPGVTGTVSTARPVTSSWGLMRAQRFMQIRASSSLQMGR